MSVVATASGAQGCGVEARCNFVITVTEKDATDSAPHKLKPYSGINDSVFTGVGYNGVTATFHLPNTDCANTPLVTLISKSTAWIYSGGSAKGILSNATAALDIGFLLGHTGNYGWKPFSLIEGPDNFGPDNNESDQIAPGAWEVIIEGPGYTDNVDHITVADGTMRMVVLGATIYDGASPAHKIDRRVYVFSGLPDIWSGDVTKSQLQMKLVHSIGDDLNLKMDYNGPPNEAIPGFYMSGSFSLGGINLFTDISFHNATGGDQTNYDKDLKASGSYPGAPYIGRGDLFTVVPKQ